MAHFYTGLANNAAAVMAALRNACVDNGWVLSGEVLSKGAAFVRTTITRPIAEHGESIVLWGGTGKDPSNVLTGQAPFGVKIGDMQYFSGSTLLVPLTYPATYDIFVLTDPDEVYLVVRHDGDRCSHLMFGVSDRKHLVGGTGLWFFGLSNTNIYYHYGFFSHPDSANWSSYGNNLESGFPAGLFSQRDPLTSFYPYKGVNAFLHHALEGTPAWTAQADVPRAQRAIAPLLSCTPSLLNGNTQLVPVQGYMNRPDNMVSMVLDLKHVRYCRNDHYDIGQVLTIGPDKWKIYPWMQRNLAARDGSAGAAAVAHSGTMAYAIRYIEP